MSRYALEELMLLRQFEELLKDGVKEAEWTAGLFSHVEANKESTAALLKVVQQSDLDHAKEQAAMLGKVGKAELHADFPYLHSLLLVRLCSKLEAAVDEAVLLALALPSIWTDRMAIEQIKVPLGKARSSRAPLPRSERIVRRIHSQFGVRVVIDRYARGRC